MIEINNLAFSYGKSLVLNNISMKLTEGHIYGLLGENGVGKTTLLSLLCGLKSPQAGTISVDGHTPFCREPSLLQDQFFLSDEVEPRNESAMSFAKSFGKFWPEFKLDVFVQIMKEFENDVDKIMKKMSAGQLKKTYIAFALASGAKYLYLDEPTNGLDIPSKSQFRSAVMKYTREDSVIVISTHQVRDLENVIDPIIILDRQDVLLNATVEEISSKLYFDYGTSVRPDALYCEHLPGSLIQVCPNVEGLESKVNIEALFNTVHNHKQMIKKLYE